MGFSFINLFTLLGAVGLFLYGMRVMSSGIQKVAGSRLRDILSAMTSNKFKGVFTGLTTTSLIQSSSAVTVMVVSFVNAGLITLTESISIIMGANIGTTVTAWLVSILGFKISITSFALPLIALGFPMLFSSKSRLRSMGEVLIGFSLLFLGIQILKDSFPDLRANPELLEFVSDYTNMGLLSLLIFILIGTVTTIILQSSSAAMAITIVMANYGWIPFEWAAAMILGENIGTTLTANVAAIVGNVYAKRAALSHFLINMFGVVWVSIIYFPFLSFITYLTVLFYGIDPSDPSTTEAIPIGLSLFHSVFNILNVLILIGFTNQIARLATRMVPARGPEEFKLEHIGSNFFSTPELSIIEAKKEILKFADITNRMSEFIRILINGTNIKNRYKLISKVEKYEKATDRIEREVSEFLTKTSEGNLSEKSSKEIRRLLSISTDLEVIADIYYHMAILLERSMVEGITFNELQMKNLNSIFDILDEASEIMKRNLKNEFENVSIEEALQKERELDSKRNELRRNQVSSIEEGSYNLQSGLVYSEMISSCEKVGDHMYKVSEALVGEEV